MVLFGEKRFNSGRWLYSDKVVVFEQSGSNRAKVVVLGLNGCIWAKWLYSGKVV